VNDTEQLITEALGKLAERTPHPGPTLNALRRKRKRHGNVFMIAAVGAAAVAALIFAGVIASDRFAPPSGNDAAAALVPGNGNALKYAPHWLPDGFVEGHRSVENGQVVRTWVPTGAAENVVRGSGPSISVASGSRQLDTTGWEDVTVRGLKGRLQLVGQVATVEWKAQETLVVTVDSVADLRETALRVADSVRADAKAVYQPVFRVNGKQASEMGGNGPADWFAQINLQPVRVRVSPQAPQVDGTRTPITLRGGQAFVAGDTVAVQDGNVWIVATGSVPVPDLVSIVDKVELLPSPDTSWLGR
jgi:hypothetical protein